jgi:cytochrome P450
MTDMQVRTTTVEFDHHSPIMPEHNWEVFADLRAKCPVAYTQAHGGYWMISGHDSVQAAARDDDTFSSVNDLDKMKGIALPAMPAKAGIIETDPPYFFHLRKAFVPWLSPGAAEARRADIQQITDYCIDQVIEKGNCDLTEDITSPVPGLLTLQFLGFSPADSERMSDLFHRHAYVPPNTLDRDQLDRDMEALGVDLYQRAAAARDKPQTGDFLSFMANVEIDGKLLSLEAVTENAFLVLAGGIDTTTSLTTNTLLYLEEHPEVRARLLDDEAFRNLAFDEFLRYYSPIQGLARTVTRDCTWAGQDLRRYDRVWLSWASANHDESAFHDPETVQLERYPNRHVAFGVGIHRCIGANLAKVSWQVMVTSILTRMPDFKVDRAACRRFPTIGVVNGWIGTPATFTPGPRVGATLPL